VLQVKADIRKLRIGHCFQPSCGLNDGTAALGCVFGARNTGEGACATKMKGSQLLTNFSSDRLWNRVTKCTLCVGRVDSSY
jgi:hypothetical protein